MASGKTTFGRLLAQQFGYAFLDLDAEIEKRVGGTIAAFFKKNGETAFRKTEQQCLQETAKLKNTVIATGGGTPCFFDNMQWMKANGVTIWLDVPYEILTERLRGQKAQRPIVSEIKEAELMTFVQDLCEKRRIYYAQADYRFLG